MTSRHKVLVFCFVFVVTCFTSTAIARADSVTSNTIVVIQGTMAGGTNDTVSAGTFTFTLPVGHTITAANLVGSAQYQLEFGAQIGLRLDTNLLTNLTGTTASTPINLALAPATFSTLLDGSSALTLSRLGGTFGGSYNLFSLHLEITTAPGSPTAPVPEPATMMLFGTGIVSLAGAAWRRRRSI